MALDDSKKMLKNYVKCERTIASTHIVSIICLRFLIVLSSLTSLGEGIVQVFDLIVCSLVCILGIDFSSFCFMSKIFNLIRNSKKSNKHTISLQRSLSIF